MTVKPTEFFWKTAVELLNNTTTKLLLNTTVERLGNVKKPKLI